VFGERRNKTPCFTHNGTRKIALDLAPSGMKRPRRKAFALHPSGAQYLLSLAAVDRIGILHGIHNPLDSRRENGIGASPDAPRPGAGLERHVHGRARKRPFAQAPLRIEDCRDLCVVSAAPPVPAAAYDLSV
jgi:hypothetical protein